MLFTFIWSLIILGIVVWGIKATGYPIPWQFYMAIAMFLLGPVFARAFRPEPSRRRRR